VGIIVVWFVNLAISALNAWGCGKSWNETRYVGGFAHFMNWMGAIMAACGFTWCNMVLLAVVGAHVPIEQDDGTTQMLLSGETLQAFCELGYLVIIGPILGSGLAITVHSWAVAWRSRRLGDGLTAGWNTFAQVYNTVSALENVPSFASHLGSFFKGDGDKKGAIVIALVAIAVLGGVLTTWWIITATARSTAYVRSSEARAA
jgi:hypothetical protein